MLTKGTRPNFLHIQSTQLEHYSLKKSEKFANNSVIAKKENHLHKLSMKDSGSKYILDIFSEVPTL